MRKLHAIAAGFILYTLSLLAASPSQAQGTIPVVLQQQFAFSACATTSAICGTPLAGGLLYIFQVGTVATPQNAFQDTGLSIQLPWPVPLDSNGRVPMFYLANGSVHVRLTDANGVVQFDIPSMLVTGASSGSGGAGTVDPTTIASTGDIKFRATSETLSGWVKLNGLTIGSATSGATGRANADTQNLFIYLWNNCASPTSNRHCAVSSGLGASGSADFTANKTLTLMDFRDSIPVGLDDMGAAAKGGILSSNVTSGGGDGPTTPNAFGGVANQAIAQANLPAVAVTGNVTVPSGTLEVGGLGSGTQGWATSGSNTLGFWGAGSLTFTGNTLGAGTALNVMQPFILGSWHIKL